MGALISEKKKKSILGVQGSAVIFAVPAIVLGVILRRQYIPFGYAEPIRSEMTDGYYGVMSGSLAALLGIFGAALIQSRKVTVVGLYLFLLLACDVLCLLDLLMVVPQVKAHGEFAWDYGDSICGSNAKTDAIDEACEKLRISAILLICITALVSLVSLLTSINTFKTGFALCEAESEPVVVHQAPLQLAPYSAQRASVQPVQGYANAQFTVFQVDGYQ